MAHRPAACRRRLHEAADLAVCGRDALDFTSRYQARERVQVFLEAFDITDEPCVMRVRTPFGDRLAQYEEYSFTVDLDARTAP